MKVTQLRLAGQGAWPPLAIDRVAPGLNVFFGPSRSGKSTLAQLVAHLLYGKASTSWRGPAAQPTAPPEGSLRVDSLQGPYLLRRHRDGTPLGRLSVAAVGGPAVDGRTVKSLLYGRSPRMLAELYAMDFSVEGRAGALLNGEFARDFAEATTAADEGAPASSAFVPAASSTLAASSRRIDELVRRRDHVAQLIEERLSGRRGESAAIEQELAGIEATLDDRRQDLDRLRLKLRAVDAQLSDAAMRLRYLSLTAAIRPVAPGDAAQRQTELDLVDSEIARCRQTLADLAARDAAVRRDVAETRADGTADGAADIADQRATLGVVERLLDDLDAEVSQVARSHAPVHEIGPDLHARLTPVAQLLRQQLYALCGQVTEQERAVRREQASAEARHLARTQADLSERLEHLLARRQSLVHAGQLASRPGVLLPQSPAANHCRCENHETFVRDAGPGWLSQGGSGFDEETARRERLKLETERANLQAEIDRAERDRQTLQARWQQLQLARSGAKDRTALDELRRELDLLETKLASAVATPAAVPAPLAGSPPVGRVWRASDVLAQLTDGELVQIRLGQSPESTIIVDRHGKLLSHKELTPAQGDQLCLSLALALVSSLGSRGIELPLVLDEPFLRQDAVGSATMAGVLEEFTREGRQLLVFTEDREAVRQFDSLGGLVHRIDELRRNETTPAVVVPMPAAAIADAPVVRVVRETVGEAKPQLRIAGVWTDQDADAYYLSVDAPLDDFPVLGNDTSRAFSLLGLRTVGDLLMADAAAVAEKLDRPAITADAVRLWQSHMSLMCYIPGVSLGDAQVLAANDVTSPEPLFTIDVRLLADSIERFLATERGRRFASSRPRFTRERLADLQKLARQHRPHWQVASRGFGWVDAPASAQTIRPAAKPTSRGRKQNRPRAFRQVSKLAPTKPSIFHLQRSSAIVAAPSIGPKLAARFAAVGVRTVADLLNADPESTAAELADVQITAARIVAWQQQARLVCRVPGLRGLAAQLLVASGLTEPEQLAGSKVDELVARVRNFCRTSEGKRLLRGTSEPSRGRVDQWIHRAAKLRPLEAA